MVIGFEAKRIFHNASGLGNFGRNLVLSLAHENPTNQYLLYNYRPGSINFNMPPAVQEIRPNFQNKLASNLWRQRLISGRAKKDGVEIFHGLAQELPYGLGKKGLKSVVTIHDLIFLRYPELYKRIDRNIYLKKVKHACKVADLVVAVSSQTRQDLIDLLQIPAAKVIVIHQGCDPLFWENHQNNILPMIKRFGLPERFALFVGTLEPRKNPARLAQVCAKLEIPLVIVGRSTRYWANFIKNSSSSEQAYWQHIKVSSTKDLATLYSLADVFIYPSIFEGFGIPVLEALASGTPVITGNNSALREIAGPGAALVNSTSAADIKKALEAFWNDEKLRQNASEKGTNFAKQFKDNVLAKQWLSTYHNVLGE